MAHDRRSVGEHHGKCPPSSGMSRVRPRETPRYSEDKRGRTETDWQVLKDSRHWVKPRSAPMIRALAEIGRMKVDVPEYESLLNQASEQEAAGEPNDELVERLQSEMT